MAEVAYTISTTAKGDILLVWEGVTESDTFQAFSLEESVTEISCHVTGTFGGATVTIKGGNISGGEVLGLTQIGGAAAACTAADIFSILDRPLFIQPTAASGTSQDVDIYMVIRR